MAQIFGAESTNSAMYKLDKATIELGTGGTGAVLDCQIQFTRQLQPIYTMNKGIQWAAMAPQGTMTANTILSQDNNFISTLGAEDTCKMTTITITPTTYECNGSTTAKITLNGAYCSGVSFSIVAQQGYIGEGLTVNFTSMTVE